MSMRLAIRISTPYASSSSTPITPCRDIVPPHTLRIRRMFTLRSAQFALLGITIVGIEPLWKTHSNIFGIDMFSYEFYLDGSIRVSVRASGYIQSAYFAKNQDYGYQIHEALSGSMHDHVLNYKAVSSIMPGFYGQALTYHLRISISWERQTQCSLLHSRRPQNRMSGAIGLATP